MPDENRNRRTTDHARRAADATAVKPGAATTSEAIAANPPRTTTWRWFTAPKFGSAGSGGAELEPGPERD